VAADSSSGKREVSDVTPVATTQSTSATYIVNLQTLSATAKPAH
jgi:hypothetical protein